MKKDTLLQTFFKYGKKEGKQIEKVEDTVIKKSFKNGLLHGISQQRLRDKNEIIKFVNYRDVKAKWLILFES